MLIGRGYANKRIALELGLAEKMVKTHVGHVLAKLGVSDRTQAAVAACAPDLHWKAVPGPIASGGRPRGGDPGRNPTKETYERCERADHGRGQVSCPEWRLGTVLRGEFAFKLGSRELDTSTATTSPISAFRRTSGASLRGEADRLPPGLPGRLFGARRIETGTDDVSDVIALLRLNYDRVAARHGIPAGAA